MVFAQSYSPGQQVVLSSSDYFDVIPNYDYNTLCDLKNYEGLDQEGYETWSARCHTKNKKTGCEFQEATFNIRYSYQVKEVPAGELGVSSYTGMVNSGDTVWVPEDVYSIREGQIFAAQKFGYLSSEDTFFAQDAQGCWLATGSQISPITTTDFPMYGPQIGQEAVYTRGDSWNNNFEILSAMIAGLSTDRNYKHGGTTTWEQSPISTYLYALSDGHVVSYDYLYWVSMDLQYQDRIGAKKMIIENERPVLVSTDHFLGQDFYSPLQPVDLDIIYDYVYFDGQSNVWRKSTYSMYDTLSSSQTLPVNVGEGLSGPKHITTPGPSDETITFLSDDIAQEFNASMSSFIPVSLAVTNYGNFYLLFDCSGEDPQNYKADEPLSICPNPHSSGVLPTTIYAWKL